MGGGRGKAVNENLSFVQFKTGSFYPGRFAVVLPRITVDD